MEAGKRARKGRPRLRWRECVDRDLRDLGVNPDDALDRSRWKELTGKADPT